MSEIEARQYKEPQIVKPVFKDYMGG